MYGSSPLSLFHLRLLSHEWKRSTHPLENFLCVPSHLTATPTFPVPQSPFRSGPVYQYLPSICVTQTFTSDIVSRLLVQFLIASIFCYLITCQPACETLTHFLLSLHKWHTDTSRTRLLLQEFMTHESQFSQWCWKIRTFTSKWMFKHFNKPNPPPLFFF